MDYQSEGGIFAGNLLIDVLDANGAQQGERDVGETSNFTIEAMKITDKQRTGHRIENFGNLIDDIILSKTQSLKFTLGDINRKNLALAMFGEDSAIDVSSSSVTDEAITARLDKEMKLSKMKIKSSPAVVVSVAAPSAWQTEHAYVLTNFVLAGTYRAECTTAGTSGVSEPTWTGKVPGETVTDGTVTWTIRKLTYTLDTDYEIDYTYGTITALSDGDIAEEQSLLVDFSYDAYTGYNVNAATLTKIDCLLRLKGKNINTGKPVMVIVHKASLKPSGSIDWITDDFAKLEFSGDIQAVGADTWEALALD